MSAGQVKGRQHTYISAHANSVSELPRTPVDSGQTTQNTLMYECAKCSSINPSVQVLYKWSDVQRGNAVERTWPKTNIRQITFVSYEMSLYKTMCLQFSCRSVDVIFGSACTSRPPAAIMWLSLRSSHWASRRAEHLRITRSGKGLYHLPGLSYQSCLLQEEQNNISAKPMTVMKDKQQKEHARNEKHEREGRQKQLLMLYNPSTSESALIID